jgi:V/A-type H+-transporting ATPase subunit I
MAIVRLRKVTLFGQTDRKDAMLVGLQSLGCVHLIDLVQRKTDSEYQHPTRSDVHAALRYLESCPDQRPAAPHADGYDAAAITRQVLDAKESHRELTEEREELVRAISTAQPWGNFHRPSAHELGGRQLWFYKLRHRQTEALRKLADPWAKISRDNEFEYIVVIADREPTGLPAPPVELEEASLDEMQQRLVEVDRSLESLELARIAATRWIPRLSSDLAMADDQTARMEATEQLIDAGEVFALQGWVPKKTLPTVEKFARENGLAMTVEKPTSDDRPPTLLTNPRAVAGAEGAVTFYMTPSYGAWDPTWIMYISFSLFFAMIMADAGYGLVLAALLAIFYRKLGKTETLRRFRYLAMFMVAVTIGYGVVIGSYFGISPPEGTLLDRYVWKTRGSSIMNDREAMMLLSAAIGVFHLATANLIVAWQKIGSSNALANVGWATALVGGLIMAVARLPEPALVPWLANRFGGSADALGDSLWGIGSMMLACGLGAVFFFSSQRPLFSSKTSDWLWRPLEGLMGLTNISKAFGDALSYLRLFALGLASAQLAITFNQLASDVSNVRGVGLLLGLLVFLAGHTLNLVLGIVGGVVHGLRLNCIEFFSWSLTDEGYPFQAFRKKADC